MCLVKTVYVSYGSLLSVRFNYKPGYKPHDML